MRKQTILLVVVVLIATAGWYWMLSDMSQRKDIRIHDTTSFMDMNHKTGDTVGTKVKVLQVFENCSTVEGLITKERRKIQHRSGSHTFYPAPGDIWEVVNTPDGELRFFRLLDDK